MELILGAVALIISRFIFDYIFYLISKKRINVFLPIQKFTSELQGKSLLRFIFLLIFISFTAIVKDYYDLNYLIFGIMVGFVSSFNDICFKNL